MRDDQAALDRRRAMLSKFIEEKQKVLRDAGNQIIKSQKAIERARDEFHRLANGGVHALYEIEAEEKLEEPTR